MSDTSELKTLLLSHSAAAEDAEVRALVLHRLHDLFPLDPARAAEVVMRDIIESKESGFLPAVESLSTESTDELINLLLPEALKELERFYVETRDPDDEPAMETIRRVRNRLCQLGRSVVSSAPGSAHRIVAGLERFHPEEAWGDTLQLLSDLAPIAESDLAEAVLDGLPELWSSEWMSRISLLNTAELRLIDSKDRFTTLLGEFCSELFRADSEHVPDDPAEFVDFLAAALLNEESEVSIPRPEQLPALPGTVSPTILGRRQPGYELLQHLVERGWMLERDAVDIVVHDASSSLTSAVTAGDERPTGDLLIQIVAQWIERGNPEWWNSLEAAVVASGWLPAEHRGLMPILLSLLGEVVDVDVEELSKWANFPITDTVIGTVVDVCALDPRELSTLLMSFTDTTVGVKTQAAIRNSSAELNGRELARLLKPLILGYMNESVDPSVFAAIDFGGASLQPVEAILKTSFMEATNNEDREKVLEIWEDLPPMGPALEKRLSENVYLPLVKMGKGGCRAGIRHFDLVADVPGVRKAVRKALRKAAKGDGELERKVEKAFLDAGWIKQRSLLLMTKSQDVDEP